VLAEEVHGGFGAEGDGAGLRRVQERSFGNVEVLAGRGGEVFLVVVLVQGWVVGRSLQAFAERCTGRVGEEGRFAAEVTGADACLEAFVVFGEVGVFLDVRWRFRRRRYRCRACACRRLCG
jgi:hypothetical protein